MANCKHFDWAIIGAGPAGIAAIGKLIDNGIDPNKIAWFDPTFQVGDFSAHWSKVSSNTPVDLFIKFLQECRSYNYEKSPDFAIKNIDLDQTCFLDLMVKPLQWVTHQLQKQVYTVEGKVTRLKLYDRNWEITLNDSTFLAKNVMLAIGAEPKSLSFDNVEEISLYNALDPDSLSMACNPLDTVAVFGSSHSAIIIIKTLIEQCNIKKIINFYKSPLRYAVFLDNWVLFDDTGLKGKTAEWARNNIDGKLPAKLERVIANDQNIKLFMPQCNKAIYATGFKKRIIHIDGIENLQYNEHSGIIAPGLFGLGIAFPEKKIDRYGSTEYRVGLWKFMDFLNKVLPVWLKYGT